jgi:hypothetical protein
MKTLLSTITAIALVTAATSGAMAQGKSAEAPGQDRTCLVTSSNGGWNDDDVASTKWLPRKAAEAQAAKDPSKMRIFDYDDDPLVTTGEYASAEELCNEHFVD